MESESAVAVAVGDARNGNSSSSTLEDGPRKKKVVERRRYPRRHCQSHQHTDHQNNKVTKHNSASNNKISHASARSRVVTTRTRTDKSVVGGGTRKDRRPNSISINSDIIKNGDGNGDGDGNGIKRKEQMRMVEQRHCRRPTRSVKPKPKPSKPPTTIKHRGRRKWTLSRASASAGVLADKGRGKDSNKNIDIDNPTCLNHVAPPPRSPLSSVMLSTRGVTATDAPPPTPCRSRLKKMTVPQLQELCVQLGISGVSRRTKKDVLMDRIMVLTNHKHKHNHKHISKLDLETTAAASASPSKAPAGSKTTTTTTTTTTPSSSLTNKAISISTTTTNNNPASSCLSFQTDEPNTSHSASELVQQQGADYAAVDEDDCARSSSSSLTNVAGKQEEKDEVGNDSDDEVTEVESEIEIEDVDVDEEDDDDDVDEDEDEYVDEEETDSDSESESEIDGEEGSVDEETEADPISSCSPMKSQRRTTTCTSTSTTRDETNVNVNVNVSQSTSTSISYVSSIIGRHHRQVAVHTKWNIMFSQLLEHYKQMGTWIISQDCHKDKVLYNWLYEQRMAYRRGYLQSKTPERFESLTKAGVPLEKDHWNRRGGHPEAERKWKEKYEELKAYYIKHCTKMVSLQNRPELYNWTHWQQKTFRRGNMSPHRLEKLREIGCPLEKHCYTKHDMIIGRGNRNNSNSSSSSIVSGVVATAKQQGAIHTNVNDNANAVSVTTHECGWEPQFQKMLGQLVRWHALHGTWLVKASENELLYRFVLKFTRSNTKRSKELRTPARMAKLRALGFPVPGDDNGNGNVKVAAPKRTRTRKRKSAADTPKDAADGTTRMVPKRRMPARHPQFVA
jgi:hypothetical protein